jgi:hypothetical protein
MRIAEMLQAIASWLEDPNNEALLIAEYDENCLEVVASSCIEAASLLRKAADTVDLIEPEQESTITPESIETLAEIAKTFDESGDPGLMAQASVIDELILTIATPPKSFAQKRAAEDKKIEYLKEKYENPAKQLREDNKISEAEKAIKESKMTEATILEGSLSTRSCPDHPGAQMARKGDHLWQCEMDKKTYNYQAGFELANGMKVPGGDVANQTKMETPESHAIFDTRESRLGGYQP